MGRLATRLLWLIQNRQTVYRIIGEIKTIVDEWDKAEKESAAEAVKE